MVRIRVRVRVRVRVGKILSVNIVCRTGRNEKRVREDMASVTLNSWIGE